MLCELNMIRKIKRQIVTPADSILRSIVCSNRDELLQRPTLNAHFHDFETNPEDGSVKGNILSGRDILAGGTWFGVTRTGKVALLTNITEPVKVYATSRGFLTSSFLLSDPSETFEGWIQRKIPPDTKFAGFNMLLFEPATSPQPDQSLHFDAALVTNHGSGGIVETRPLSAQKRSCGCVSNAIDGNDTVWPKVEHATQDFDSVLQTLSSDTTENELVDRLFDVLE
ncbi:hypothetical protein H0H93_009448 [Arthromyces matolae]|nr:hypothetical protein H0H93_009448 [Arthromyces matolae]